MSDKAYELKNIINAYQNNNGDYVVKFKDDYEYKEFDIIPRAIFETFFDTVPCCDKCGEKIINLVKSDKWYDYDNYCSEKCMKGKYDE